MTKITRRGKIALAGTALALVGIVGGAASADSMPNEDEPGWNCYTHGNKSCGDVLKIKVTGAVLEAATDGRVYVSWSDGRVTHATRKQRYKAWVRCIDKADGSDASVFACDEGFMEKGDVRYFAMRDTHGQYN